MKQELELKLQAWLDGELPAAEAAKMRRLAESDPEAERLVAGWRELNAVLARHEPTVALPETREFYWSKIQQQIRRQERERQSSLTGWSWRWRRWLAPLAGASALVAALLLTVRQPARPVALNQVSVTAAGFQARAFRDQSSGMNFVYLQETPKTGTPVAAPGREGRAREDGSSFMIDTE